MSVYSRYKKNPEGFRTLVELMENTPSVRRNKMIDVGMVEDAAYTQKALSFMMSFQDIVSASEGEIMEIFENTPSHVLGHAISSLSKMEQERLLKLVPRSKVSDVNIILENPAKLSEAGGAQLKIVSIARKLEKAGKIKIKQIPLILN